MKNILGKRIKQLRIQHNFRQKDLADKLHISNTTLSQYENGLRIPSDEIKIKISNCFDVSLDYLLGNSDDPRPTYIYTDEEVAMLQVMLEDPQFKEIFERLNKLGPEEQKLVLELVDRIASSDDIDKKEQKK